MAQPEQTPAVKLAHTASHTELDLAALAEPGPTLQVNILTFSFPPPSKFDPWFFT